MPTLPPLESRDGYPHRLLPGGIYPADLAAVWTALVDPFPQSRTRGPIFAGLTRLHGEMAGHGVHAKQWLDGSFVEGKLDPGDVDLVTLIDAEILNALGAEAKQFVRGSLVDGGAGPACHSFLVAVYAVGHPLRTHSADVCHFWRRWFGHTKSVAAIPKGLIELVVGDPRRAPDTRGLFHDS